MIISLTVRIQLCWALDSHHVREYYVCLSQVSDSLVCPGCISNDCNSEGLISSPGTLIPSRTMITTPTPCYFLSIQTNFSRAISWTAIRLTYIKIKSQYDCNISYHITIIKEVIKFEWEDTDIRSTENIWIVYLSNIINCNLSVLQLGYLLYCQSRSNCPSSVLSVTNSLSPEFEISCEMNQVFAILIDIK